MKPISSADLAVIGEALFGPRWKAEVSYELGIPYRSLMRWLADGSDLEVEHVATLRILVRSRLAYLEEARKLLWSKLEARDVGAS